MARSRRKTSRRKASSRKKVNLRKGQCKVISTPSGRRKICKLQNGKVRFRKMRAGA